ncbi:MAG TPA: ribonuclease P protein component [Mycobacteriales bacterium]|jgi:ribonuclease P protein component|nr:ribonuclease protein component [Mycobacterium sp.]
MLPASARLRRREDFSRVVRAGRRVGRGALVVHVAGAGIGRVPAGPGDGDVSRPDDSSPAPAPAARAGFVVSKAVGPAVTRNLVTRRLRHLVRERLGELPDGVDLVVRALPAAATRPYDALAGDLDAALAKAVRRPEAATPTR